MAYHWTRFRRCGSDHWRSKSKEQHPAESASALRWASYPVWHKNINVFAGHWAGMCRGPWHSGCQGAHSRLDDEALGSAEAHLTKRGISTASCVCDVGDKAQVQQMVEVALRRFGGVDHGLQCCRAEGSRLS
jgi:hypothetical protein